MFMAAGRVGRQMPSGAGLLPSLDLNFGSGVLDPRITFTRAAGPATYFDATGTLQLAAFNFIRNNTMVGAVAGSPGTLPTNWTLSGGSGLTQTVVGTGTENGISFVDIRLNGTTTAANPNIAFEVAAVVAATQNQVWTGYFYCRLVGGTLANCTGVKSVLFTYTSAPAFLNSFFGPTVVPSNAPLATQQVVATATLVDATTASVRPIIQTLIANGVAIDLTLRIGMPQLELSPTASAAIPTYGAANGAPRFDYDPVTHAARGLLIEEARTNGVTNSGPLTDFVPANATKTAAATQAPDGTTTGVLLTENTATSAEHNADFSFTPIANTQYTASVFVKAGARTYAGLAFRIIGNWVGGNIVTVFNLSNGTIFSAGLATNPTIVSVGGGWYRCTITATSAATISGASPLRLNMCDSSGNGVYTGDGVSTTYFWGAQLEVGAFPTSYIPTTAAAATRALDVMTIAPANMSPWFNTLAGSWQMSLNSFAAPVTIRRLINSGTGTSVYPLYQLSANVIGSFDGVAATTPNTTTQNVPFKGASSWSSAAKGSVCLNGGTVTTSASQVTGFSSLAANGIRFFGDYTNANPNSGWLTRVAYWPRALSNAELQQVTT